MTTNSSLKQSLKDWVDICLETKTQYCVIGSVALVAALRKAHRNPNDLDVLYDFSKEELIKSALLDKGYEHSHIDTHSDLFPRKLDRFTKGNSIIEPRRAEFSSKGMSVTIVAPIKVLPKFFRPHLTLSFGKEMSKLSLYNLQGIVFKGLSREAIWVALKTFEKQIKHKDKGNDLKNLSRDLDKKKLKKIYKNKSGVYYQGLPIITFKTIQLFNIFGVQI